ncbi:hypothetical protein SBA3_1920032 [Candidatus Sulfopaludibacter sp. SbA3]|nr:hypothetical protein SBA3_1920032 [Candidatus Sulfopaludibacter sp. SbA3]
MYYQYTAEGSWLKVFGESSNFTMYGPKPY